MLHELGKTGRPQQPAALIHTETKLYIFFFNSISSAGEKRFDLPKNDDDNNDYSDAWRIGKPHVNE